MTATLRGVSELRSFFRTNQTPVFFVSPTPFNLLGHRPVGAQLSKPRAWPSSP